MSVSHNTPVHFLPSVGARTARVMHELGIHTAGQLSRVPEQVLIELFGPSIKSILTFAGLQQQRTVRAGSSTALYGVRASADVSRESLNTKRSLFKRLQLASQFVSML